MKNAKGDPVARARERLLTAIDRASGAAGDLQWIHGYRTGRVGAGDQTHYPDLLSRQQAAFRACDRADAAMMRAMRAYAAAIRQAKKRQA